MEKIKLIYPEEVGFNGGITYRFFPACVECQIISQDEAGFNQQTGRAIVSMEYSEHYNIQGMAREALRAARRAECKRLED